VVSTQSTRTSHMFIFFFFFFFYFVESFGCSEYVCSEGGIDCSHSIDDVMFIDIILLRDDENLSHIMNTRNSTPIREIIDPIDDTMFHIVYASG
jgi:hypothetical protein